MIGKKKKLSRREQKLQKQQQKEQVRHRTGWQEPETPELNWQLLDDLRPFLGQRNMEKGLMTIMELAADSDGLVDEPEFRDLFFPPIVAIMLFVDVIEGEGITADAYFALDEEVRSEKFYEIVEQILPKLVDEEFRATFVERAESARTRFRDEGNEQKLWQTSAVQFVLEIKGDEEADFYPGLLYTIAAKSVEAGPLLIRSDDAELDEVDEEAAEERIDLVPGLRDYLNEIMRTAQSQFVRQMLDGDLLFQLFTDAELEGAVELLEEDTGETLDVLGDYLMQILTEPRRAELGARLDVVMAELPEHLERIRPFLKDIQDDLPELAPYTSCWAALVAALLGEVNAYDPDE